MSQSCINVCYMFHSQTCMYTCMLRDSKTCHTCRPVCCVLTVTPTDLYVVSQTCMLCVDCHTYRPISFVTDLYVVCHWPICCVTYLYAVCCVSSVSVTDLCVVCLRPVCCVSQPCMLCHRPVCCMPTVTFTDLCCVSYQCHIFVCCVSTVTLSVSQTCMLCIICHIISVTDLYLVCLRPVCCVTIPVLHLSQTNNSVCCVADL